MGSMQICSADGDIMLLLGTQMPQVSMLHIIQAEVLCTEAAMLLTRSRKHDMKAHPSAVIIAFRILIRAAFCSSEELGLHPLSLIMRPSASLALSQGAHSIKCACPAPAVMHDGLLQKAVDESAT